MKDQKIVEKNSIDNTQDIILKVNEQLGKYTDRETSFRSVILDSHWII